MVRILATLENAIDEYSQEGSRTSQPWRMTDWSLALVWKAHIEPVFICIYVFLLPHQMYKVAEGGRNSYFLVCDQFKDILISKLLSWSERKGSLIFDPIPLFCCLSFSAFQEAHLGSTILHSCNWAALPVAHLWPLYTRFHWDLMACLHDPVPWVFC